MNNQIIIHGCGGHARSVANIILSELNYEVFFVDVNARNNEYIFGCPVLKRVEDIKDWRECAHHIGAGDIGTRKFLFEKYKQAGCKFPVIASKSSCIAPSTHIAEDVFIGAGAYVGPNADIGMNTIINTHAVVEHDVRIGMHSHISVNSTIAGYAKVGSQTFIGAGATIIDKIHICNNTIIGAGAVVVISIKKAGTYVGVPAKCLKDI